MRRLAQRAAATTLGLALVAAPLTGCGSDGGKTPETTTSDTVAAIEESKKRVPTGSTDIATWETLGDVFAAAEEDPSYGYDEGTYVAVVSVNGRRVYVTARMTPEVYEALCGVDVTASDATKKAEDALSPLELTTVEDITDEVLPQAELDALVGKTGKDLVDEGFAFSSYLMYGGEEGTIASFDKGYYSYEITFAASTPESDAEDGGASVMDATVTGASSGMSLSQDALDPTKVGQVGVVDVKDVTEAVETAGKVEEGGDSLKDDAGAVTAGISQGLTEATEAASGATSK